MSFGFAFRSVMQRGLGQLAVIQGMTIGQESEAVVRTRVWAAVYSPTWSRRSDTVTRMAVVKARGSQECRLRRVGKRVQATQLRTKQTEGGGK
jgi:hypothetical protein